MNSHPIQLRWPGRCHLCCVRLAVGDRALFDPASRDLTCRHCADGELPLFEAPPVHRPTEAERDRIKALIAEARAVLEASRQAG